MKIKNLIVGYLIGILIMILFDFLRNRKNE